MDKYRFRAGKNASYMILPDKAFAGFSVMTLADLLQLPLVRGKLLFSQFSDKDSMKHY